MKKLLVAVTAIASVFAAEAQAERQWPQWYVGLSGGPTFLDDSDISGAATGNVNYESVGGFGALALGYTPPVSMQPFSNMRFEVQLGYHRNEIDSAVLGGTPVANPRDGMDVFTYMGNMYYDVRNSSTVTPYIGGGAGGARVSLSKNSGLGNTGSNDNVFAYQFMGGLSYAPTYLHNVEWVLGYRYFAMQDPEFRTATTALKIEDYRTHNVEVGGRFKF